MRKTTRTKPEFEMAKTIPGRSQLERVRSARAILDGTRQLSKATELSAFLSIFHPELPEKRVLELIADVRAQERKK